MAWEIVVGLETHAQLLTESKMFSAASTAFGAPPNTQASAVDIALPGTLPVANKAAVELAIRFGLLVGGRDVINRRSTFERKNYFYPDLPKGYQISQWKTPIVKGGEIAIESPTRGKIKIRLTRAHLEEDAGKSLHEDFHGMTGVDLNRAGTPLLEIVSEPDLRSAEEAVAYAKRLHELVTSYGICGGNMEEGSFRCDANVSVRKRDDPKLGTRCEIKNLNSFRFMEQAIEFEAKRQIAILEEGGKIDQETRLYDPERNETRSMRTKEDAHDYRYFPDPDLLPLVVPEADIERIQGQMPRSLDTVRLEMYGRVPASQIAVLTATRQLANFSTVALEGTSADTATVVANLIAGPLSARLNEENIDDPGIRITARDLRALAELVTSNEISASAANQVLPIMWKSGDPPAKIVRDRNLKQISDAGEIEKLVDQVLASNAKQVEDYRAGKEKAFNSLVGQVMKASQGKANPAQVNEILRRKLST